jgi:hypothetical protein
MPVFLLDQDMTCLFLKQVTKLLLGKGKRRFLTDISTETVDMSESGPAVYWPSNQYLPGRVLSYA